MPEGISVIVDDEGYANITFEDRALRGPALDKLIKIGGAETVDKSTENGYPVYRVPEGNARAAGLLSARAGKSGRVIGAVVHVADDGTETPSVPDADGLHTLVVNGPVNPDAEQVQAQQVNDPQVVEPVEPPAGTPLTEEEQAAAAAAAEVKDNGSQPAPADNPEAPAAPEVPDAPAEKKYPEGEPTTKWHLPELKAYAADHGKDAEELRTKAEVLELINSK